MRSILLLSGDNCTVPAFGYRCKSALESLGCEVSVFNYRFLQGHRFDISKRLINDSILKKAKQENPDLVLVLKGESILPGIIEEISSQGIKTANWSVDDPFGEFSKFNEIANRNEYDKFFVFDPFYVKKLKDETIDSYYLPCAADSGIHKEMIGYKNRDERYDVSFVGTHDEKREKVCSLTKAEVWGYHWKDYARYHGLIHGNKSLKEMHRMCHIFNESKINLNIHYTHSRQSVNLRTFEIPSTRSFQLCDDFSEIKNLFSKKELVTYKDEKDLLELIDYYRDNIEERSRLAEAGHRRVMKDHTFKNRMQDILSKF